MGIATSSPHSGCSLTPYPGQEQWIVVVVVLWLQAHFALPRVLYLLHSRCYYHCQEEERSRALSFHHCCRRQVMMMVASAVDY